MKLYRDGKCMQMVDKDQLQICLDAGWSRTDEVAEAQALEDAELEELQAIEDAKKLLDSVEDEDSAPKKKIVKKTSRKKK